MSEKQLKLGLETVKVLSIHVLAYFVFFLILSFLEFVKGMPTDKTISGFDAGWYQGIVEHGYIFDPNAQSNVAFFPLFPIIWKITGLSAIGISILNFFFMGGGFYFLRKSWAFSNREMLILLSIPSLMFCYVPYSEAIFFLAASLMLYGLDKNYKIALLGIFISSMVRSASMVFIPVIIFVQIFAFKEKSENRKNWLETGGMILTTVLGTLLAQYYVYLQSGKFFALFEAQKHWGRVLSWPKFFLTSWFDSFRIWVDGLAFLVGLISACLALYFLWKRFKESVSLKPSFLFSIGYLAMVTLTTLLYSGDGTDNTSMASLNRFVFAVPFSTVLLVWWMHHGVVSKKSWLFFVIVSIATWVSFAPEEHYFFLDRFTLFFDTGVAYILIVFGYSIVYFLFAKQKIKTDLWSGLYVLNISVQIYLFVHFLRGIWVG